MRRRGAKLVASHRLLVASFKLSIFLSLLFFVFSFSFAWGYPIEETLKNDSSVFDLLNYSNLGLDQASKASETVNSLVRSLFGPGVLSFSLNESLGKSFLNKFSGDTDLSFDSFINTKSFSSNDISGSIRAVVILFLKLVVLSLSIILAIFKTILDLVLSWY